MIKNPYDTKTGSMYNVSDFIESIIEAISDKKVEPIFGDATRPDIIVVKGGKGKAFLHPVRFKDPLDKDKVKIAIDARPYGRMTREGMVEITDYTGYRLLHLRALLEGTCEEEMGYRALYNSSDLPFYVMTTWLANNLSSRFDLTPEEQVRAQIIAAFYYYSMHGNVSVREFKNEEFEERTFITIAKRISNVMRIPVAKTLEFRETIRPMYGLIGFIDVIKDVIKTSRLDDLNLGTAITIFAASAGWRGIQARELVAIGLEHAPTWHALVAFAGTERNHRESRISKIARNFRGADDGDRYLKKLMTVSNYQYD